MRSIILFVLSITACSGSSPQVLTGHAGAGYTGVTTLRAMHGSTVLASTPLASDGSFRIVVPASRNVTLQLVGTMHSDVVFPRHTGVIQRGFTIRGSGQPFDLGGLHLVVGAMTNVAFHDGASSGECHDGKDATGAVCVDDGDDDTDTCDANDGDDTDDDNGAEADTSTDAPDEGDSTADHNFPSDGCSGDDGSEHEGSDSD